MDNRQSPAAFRVSDIPLYTIPKNTAYSVHKQPGLILPSIKDLQLPMTKTINAETQTQTEVFQAVHDGNTALPPLYSPTTRRNRKDFKQPYTTDQVRFIQGKRDGENMPWIKVTEEYNREFPGCHRTRSGLEARYYREQLVEERAAIASRDWDGNNNS
ncbi:hypothetical protein V492_00373 [Pseudogymnoascus sp. VKM F-4246]|nr:hypothetical protein V492_00373 [Pseudogymnoascus sp. VKM F-4246]